MSDKRTTGERLAVIEQILMNVEKELKNHLASHARREIAFIAIIGSLAVSLIGLVAELFIGG